MWLPQECTLSPPLIHLRWQLTNCTAKTAPLSSPLSLGRMMRHTFLYYISPGKRAVQMKALMAPVAFIRPFPLFIYPGNACRAASRGHYDSVVASLVLFLDSSDLLRSCGCSDSPT